jgi:hypothetical protein
MVPFESFIKNQAIMYLSRLHNEQLNLLLHEVHTLTKILDTQGTSAHMQKYIRRNWY